MKKRILLGCSVAIFLLGCGDSSATGGGGSAPEGGNGGLGGTGGSPPACGPGSHEDEGECVSTLAAWTEGPSLAQARDHHASFVIETADGAFLYAAGGVENNTTLLADVEIAELAEDGTIAEWTSTTPLPEVTAGAGVAVVGDVVVIAGGYRMVGAQAVLSKTTNISVVGEGGELGPWSEGPSMALTRFHGAMAVHGAQVFVVGGLTGDNTVNTDSVQRAEVGADGTLGAWADVTALPHPLSHHSVAVYQDALFVTGGLEGDPNVPADYEVFADVLRAPILEDGSLGAWENVGTMPHTLSTHASFVRDGQLYVVGGIEDDLENTDAVVRAPIAADGTVGPWEEQPPVPTKRAHAHQTPLFGPVVYAVGGALNHVSTDRVFIGRFE